MEAPGRGPEGARPGLKRKTAAGKPSPGFRPVTESFAQAWSGLYYVYCTQRNMRFHVLAGALAGAACLLFGVSRTEALMVVLAVAGVLIAEVANTVAESLTNLMEPQLSAIAKVTKDVGAAGVLLAAGFSVLVAGLVFYPVLWDLPQRLAGFVDRRLPYFGAYLAVVVIPSAIGPLLPQRCNRRGRR